jgi:class 3 adenylate cyclase
VSESNRSEAEYKLVTILFADIVGSTDLTTRLGAEKARVVFDRCLQRMGAAVDEYGGTVARLMGDGLLAFFGAPQAHEDDPERAVMAAMRMHESVEAYASELGETTQIRIGLNTGRAVLGEVGGDSLSEYTAMGNSVVLAQRLEAAGGAGETRMGESTARLVGHRFELEQLERFDSMSLSRPTVSPAPWSIRRARAGSPALFRQSSAASENKPN